MEKTPNLSIIIPVYKIPESFLRQCLNSICKQSSEEIEVILIDDGSPDDCGKTCDEYADKFDFIYVIHQENSGVSCARNAGIMRASAPWLMFVDPDDWIEEHALGEAIKLLKSNAKDADIILFDYIDEIAGGTVPKRLSVAIGYCSEKIIHECRLSIFYKLIQGGKENPYSLTAVWDKIYKTSFLKQNDLFFLAEARKGQDRIFNASALCSTDKIFYSGQTLYHYRWNVDSVSNRYNPKLVDYTLLEISSLENAINKFHLGNEFKKSLVCRCCTRIYSLLRLNFFHKDNPDSYRGRKAKLKKLLSSDPFYSALKKYDKSLLSRREKVFIYCITHKMFLLCLALVKLYDKKKQRKLS